MKIVSSASKFIRTYAKYEYNPFIIEWLGKYLASSYFDKTRNKYAHFEGRVLKTELYCKNNKDYLRVTCKPYVGSYLPIITYNLSISNFIKYIRNNYTIFNDTVDRYGNIAALSEIFVGYRPYEMYIILEFMRSHNIKSKDLVIETRFTGSTFSVYGKVNDKLQHLFGRICLV